MPRLACTVAYRGMISPSAMVTKDMMQRALRDTWSKIGWHMYENFVAKHFTKAGADEYRAENIAYGVVAADDTYRARSGDAESGRAFWKSYNGRKQKRLGHQLAMVFSGRTRDGAKRATIYPTSSGVRVALPGCVNLNQYKPKAKKHGPHAGEPPLNLRGDLLAISRRERDECGDLHEQLLCDALEGKAFDYNYVVTIKP